MTGEGVLYIFKGSFNWVTAPQLAIRELECRDIVIEYVNLEDADLRPNYLKLNHKSDSPTLVTPSKVFYDPIEIVNYLCRTSSKRYRITPGRLEVMKLLYCSGLNPNFAAISSRNEADLQSRFRGKAATYLRDRQTALEHLARISPENREFYETKRSQNGILVSLLDNTASPEIKQSLFARSKRHWENVARFILIDLPSHLPESGFAGGNEPGEDDFHLIAWLTRTILVLGGTPSTDGVRSLEKELGGERVPRKVQGYWETWTRRESWKYQFRSSFR